MKRSSGIVLLAAALFALLAGLGAREDFWTHDEAPFLHYGYLHLQGEVPRNQRFNSKLPVNALHALPVLVVERVTGAPAFARERGDWARANWTLPWGRAVSVLLGAALVVAIGFGARRLAGPRAGAAAALIAALEPNLLAHLHLVTADGGATLATFLSVLAAMRFARTRAPRDAALLGATLGLVLLTKFMLLVWVLAIFLVVFLARAWRARTALLALAVMVLVLDAGFFFRGLPGRLPDAPRSKKVSVAKALLGRAPLPVPDAFLEGLDWTAGDEEQGAGFGNLYLLGATQTQGEKRGWPWYYLVVFALKVPLPLLALAGLGLAWNRGPAWRTPRLLALAWLLFLSLGNHAQIGIRHALPLVPLLVLEAGAAYAALERRRPWLARALIVWLGASVLSFAGDFVPYTNELVLDRKEAWRLLADSNLDWGQSKGAAAEFRVANPDVHFEPEGPVRGRILVSVNALVGVTEPPEKFAWLRAHEPVAHVRHGHLLFSIP